VRDPAAFALACCIHGISRNRRTGSLLICTERNRCRVSGLDFVAGATKVNIGT
jgi:hypothetical protein